jgi:hypothetical protein
VTLTAPTRLLLDQNGELQTSTGATWYKDAVIYEIHVRAFHIWCGHVSGFEVLSTRPAAPELA